MKKTIRLTLACAIVFGILLASCSKDEVFSNPDDDLYAVSAKASLNSKRSDLKPPSRVVRLPSKALFNDLPFDLLTAVEPSECSSTPFNEVINASIESNLDALGLDWYNLYAEMNFLYTITDESKPYFGDKGQYTKLVNKITRGLEKFWNMPDEVSVRGQHNSTLNDYNKIMQILMFWYGLSKKEANEYACYFINFVNVKSTFLIESPLVSFDGFAIALDGLFDQHDLIVVGDGLVELASKAGVDTHVVWAGIIGHEWGHHIQFNNMEKWYPNGAAKDPAEASRTLELEADFLTGYYLTHKKGGTHKWEKTRDFFELFFNIGDCSFESEQHHGTPLQRMAAAKRGFRLAERAERNGIVLTQDQVHRRFLYQLTKIVDEQADDKGDNQGAIQ